MWNVQKSLVCFLEISSVCLSFCSIQEWHEDTQIEPVQVTEEETNIPLDLTNGLAYIGYGSLYLDLLRKATSNVTVANTTSAADLRGT